MSGPSPSINRSSRIKEWGTRILVGWLLLGLVYTFYEWIWQPPPPLYSNTVTHGEWIIGTTTDSGVPILSAASCLEEQCVLFANIDIMCFPHGTNHHLSIIVGLPRQYSLGLDQITEGGAQISLKRPESEKLLGSLKTKVLPAYADHDVAVELSEVDNAFNAMRDIPQARQAFLKVDAGWPIRFDIPLDGFQDGFKDLMARCGEGWRLP